MTNSCECSVCVRHRRFSSELEKIPEANRAYFEELYDALTHAEFDLEYYKAVASGRWPDSDRVIAHMRKKAENENPKTE